MKGICEDRHPNTNFHEACHQCWKDRYQTIKQLTRTELEKVVALIQGSLYYHSNDKLHSALDIINNLDGKLI